MVKQVCFWHFVGFSSSVGVSSRSIPPKDRRALPKPSVGESWPCQTTLASVQNKPTPTLYEARSFSSRRRRSLVDMKHTVVFFVKPCSSLSSTPKHVQREIRLNEATQKLSHIQQNYHMRFFLLRFTYYIYKPVYANESSKYASQLANSVRPEKKGIAREI